MKRILRTPKSKMVADPEVRKPSPTPDFKYTQSGKEIKKPTNQTYAFISFNDGVWHNLDTPQTKL